jgi:DNA-3-methyladenine glycosylase
MNKILKEEFFQRSALQVAKEMPGKYLIRESEGEIYAGMITEVEAYDGPEDKANHASIGRTKRNEPMFAEGGHIYVYLTYGIHNMVNIVTGRQEYPAAVLIRGTDQVSGPGRLTKFYSIDRGLNKLRAEPANGLWIEDRSVKINKNDIVATARVGVQSAGEPWASKPYRFLLNDRRY